MKQLDRDIQYFEFCKKFFCKKFLQNVDTDGMLDRILGYMQELKLFRMREMMNVETELNSVQAQMQLSKSELESYNRWQIAREMQDSSQITKQGEA